jgi:hypothetical protein
VANASVFYPLGCRAGVAAAGVIRPSQKGISSSLDGGSDRPLTPDRVDRGAGGTAQNPGGLQAAFFG